MKHKIEVDNPSKIAGDREWIRAFGKIRDEFIAALTRRMDQNAVQDFRECDPRGRPRESPVEDVPSYLASMIDDGVPVAYAVCEDPDGTVLWFCAADELRKAHTWPG